MYHLIPRNSTATSYHTNNRCTTQYPDTVPQQHLTTQTIGVTPSTQLLYNSILPLQQLVYHLVPRYSTATTYQTNNRCTNQYPYIVQPHPTTLTISVPSSTQKQYSNILPLQEKVYHLVLSYSNSILPHQLNEYQPVYSATASQQHHLTTPTTL